MEFNEMNNIDTPIAYIDENQKELFTLDTEGNLIPIDFDTLEEDENDFREVIEK